ncbi:A disintegrin and metalloproteinase with thrombospondin motifs 18 [Exaiptasia diaphana]|uniref:Uncharacterized protein n=1 Tax=Exaiptasia diaphana TaxID=2652724 RepID=A0A913YB24_EXADI|nr:A disintegrin and metalloproteinase with thrombospondin motifs 18 [Exaiptasia diaphana]
MLDTDVFMSARFNWTTFNETADFQHFTKHTHCLSSPCKKEELCLPDYDANNHTCKACKELGVPEGLSEWSAWSKCDKLCVTGKQRRQRNCSNPRATCNRCEVLSKTRDEKECNFCPESPIRTYDNYCVQPKSGDCNPVQDTSTWSHSLIMKRADESCSAKHLNFIFDSDGRIYHKCSGKVVCPQGNGSPWNGQRLVLMDTCPEDIVKHKRLPNHVLQNTKNDLCVHPYGGWPGENVYLNYYGGCSAQQLALNFFKLSPP